MIPLPNLFETIPDFINEKQVKWWKYKLGNDYAKSLNLKDIYVWAIEEANGNRSYVITDKKSVLKEAKQLEELGIQLDMLAIVKGTVKL